MGPVEALFLSLIAFFGVVGIVRGYHRELGVTALLLVGLFLIEFAQDRFGAQVSSLVARGTGGEGAELKRSVDLLWVGFLIVVAFISYQGETLIFPGAGRNPMLGLLIGLLNGYLFAGSIWYYLADAGYPAMHVVPPFTALYDILFKVLPPVVLNWQFLIVVVAVMLLIRVWR